jgi:hypothetical protein
MARDKRQRLKTIPVGWALVSEASGDWLHLTTTVRNALDYYVNNWTKDGEHIRTVYDRSQPGTWAEVCSHMWRNDVELVRIDGGEATFTLARGESLTTDISMFGAGGANKRGGLVLTQAEIEDQREPLAIVNTFASQERP